MLETKWSGHQSNLQLSLSRSVSHVLQTVPEQHVGRFGVAEQASRKFVEYVG
jgi:hypothetical protein